ncbi:MAG: hypothetical protein JXR97_16700, partial [Planctomycetes bacterium]|nr:hypothetical protein [Planctomycetota bacterium]
MNATLKSICGLLRHGNGELQQAAIKILGAIRPREPAVYKAMGELLVETEDNALFSLIIDAIEANPQEHALKYLLMILERDINHDEQIYNAIARIGTKAVPAIKRQFERAPTQTQYKIVCVLPKLRNSQAHAMLVECFFSTDHDLVRNAVHALRDEVGNYSAKEKTDLNNRLLAALNDRRCKVSEAALSAVIIALGIIADIRSKDKLVTFTSREHSTQIRRHALMSLSRLEYVGDKHAKLLKALFPILDENDYEGLVRHAVAVMIRVKPRRADNNKIQALLGSKHIGVQEYAIQAIGTLDSITN